VLPVLAALRSGFAVLLLLPWMCLGGLYQRLVVYPLAHLWPRARTALVSRYFRGMSHGILFLMRVGGASLRRSGSVPTDKPTLILMNHQSLLDIPIAGLMSAPFVPRFVTRKRYHYGVPAVSPCLRLLGCPVIEPRDRMESLRIMKASTRALEHGMLIFAEGHRTLDGEIQPFQMAGVLTVLRERRLPTYLIVTDGFWSARRFVDFLISVGKIRGETEVLGPFEPPEGADAMGAFVEGLREKMIAHLATLRGRRSTESKGGPE